MAGMQRSEPCWSQVLVARAVNAAPRGGVNTGVSPVRTVDHAFEAFVAASSARLLRTAYLLCGDRAASEDLLQMTLVRVAGQWTSASDAPAAYAHRVLVNLLHDRRRRQRRRVIERPLGPSEEDRLLDSRDHAISVVEREAILAAVRRLSLRQREVLVLRFYGDLSVAETARAIGISEGSVKTHTTRALAALRATVGTEVRHAE
jgi:RNA polymerase sigma-70 factor (sigma-E family)